MLRRTSLFGAAIFLLSFTQCMHALPMEETRRAFTVDDLLKIEGIGAVQFTPNRESIIFEYLPPYDERGQYGIDRGGQILQLDISGERKAEPLFEHQADQKYWFGDRSPDSRRLLVFQASREEVRLGIYDFETRHLTLIDELPQVNEHFEMNNPLWINDHEIILSIGSKDWSQYRIRTRPYIADRTSTLREKAFAGESSVASVSTSPVDQWHDGELIRYNVITKSKVTLGQGRFGGFALSTDGGNLSALRLGQRRLHFPVGQLTDFHRFDTQLFVFDLGDNTAESFLPSSHVLMGSLRWSQSGSKLSFFAWDISAPMGEGAHYLVESGSTSPIRIEDFAPTWIDLVPSGAQRLPVAAEWVQEQLVVHGMFGIPEDQQTADQASMVDAKIRGLSKWYAVAENGMSAKDLIVGGADSREVHRLHDGRLILQTDNAFFVVSDSEAPVALRFPNHGTIQILNGRRGDEIRDTIAFTVSAEGRHEFGFLDLTRFELAAPTTEVASRVIAWAPDTPSIIARSDSKYGGTLYVQSPTKTPLEIFTFNDHVSEIEHPHWSTIKYLGADGNPTFSCILLPYNYDLKKSYPTIVDVYPGTGKGCQSTSNKLRQALGAKSPTAYKRGILSANGYLVVRPSNTYELNHSDGTFFGGLASQVDAALDALVDEGMTDPERIGIWGFSNGSMASLWLASVSDRYKAVVPMFGASSPHIEYFGGGSSPTFQSHLGTPLVHLVQYEAASGSMPHSMGSSAIDDPLAYVKASPLDRAKYICSPMMMVHSDFDSFTPYHYEALYSAMYRLGKSAELVRYYGEGHGIRSPGNIRDFYERVLAFFDKHVAVGVPLAPCN